MEYNKNPYDLDADLTVAELYEKWTDHYFETLTNPSSKRTIRSAWNYCSSIYNMQAKDLRARHIKGCMEHGTYVVDGKEKHPSHTTKTKIKSLFNLMLDYALEYEIVDKNYARTFKLSDDIIKDIEEAKKDHIDFTDEEIKKLWNHLYDTDYVDVLLIQCYSGWRPQELGLIKTENVDLENWFFSGGIKTDAGKDRLVPIHPKIRDLVKQRYQEALSLGSEYLINCIDTKTHRNSKKLTYDKYRHKLEKIIKKLDLNQNHRAHDGRVQFATMAKDTGVDEYALKYMMGHKIKDITESTYTRRKPEWLMAEIMKIK
ncbi:MAG: tyrosine-type recombinase/integrase [Anaerostipes sp.]